MPKVLEFRPGTRPAAMYVLGEIPARPVLREPPLSLDYFRLWVPDGDAGRWHVSMPYPYMMREADHLRRLGIVDDAEGPGQARALALRGEPLPNVVNK